MSGIVLAEGLRERLHANLLEERDLAEGIGLGEIAEIPGRPGRYRCTCTVPVRRTFDPETAELRRLEVTLRKLDEQRWLVESIEGLAD